MELKLTYECVHKKTGARKTKTITRTISNLDQTIKEAYNVYYDDKRKLEKEGYRVDSVQEKVV